MLTRADRIRLVEEEARRREAARRPEPWWTKGELVGRNEFLARRFGELAGQEAVVLLAEGADHLYSIGPGPVRMKLSFGSPGKSWVWVSIGEVCHGLQLSRVLGIFTLEEARECEVLP